MAAIGAVRSLALPEGAIGAGFVRNLVWDHLHGREDPTPLNDIDVLCFDPSDCSHGFEARQERRLGQAMPGLPWSVRNQARMHAVNGDPPYSGTLHAMSNWLETATAIAVRQTDGGELELLAPFGTADLFALRLVPTEAGRRKPDAFANRIGTKGWLRRWPGLRVAVTGDAESSPRR